MKILFKQMFTKTHFQCSMNNAYYFMNYSKIFYRDLYG